MAHHVGLKPAAEAHASSRTVTRAAPVLFRWAVRVAGPDVDVTRLVHRALARHPRASVELANASVILETRASIVKKVSEYLKVQIF